MSQLRRRDIQKSLRGKGFKQKSNWWYFWYEGRRTEIRVLLSSGQKYDEYGDTALGMKKQLLKLDTLSEVKALFKCPMNHDKYVQKLRSKGIRL